MSDENENPKEVSESAQSTAVIFRAGGPLSIQGNFEMKDKDGNLIECKERVNICRCGHSSNQPFCDGSHKGAEFSV